MATTAAYPTRRRKLALVLACAAALVVPASAHAATATTDKAGKLTYKAPAGEANRVVASWQGAGVVAITDTGRAGTAAIAVTGSGGCVGWGSSVTCTGVTSLAFDTGDAGDVIDSRSVPLATSVTTGPAADRIATGDGADTLKTAGGDDALDGGAGADKFSCGAGNDVATADALDSVAHDCESIAAPAPAGATDPLPEPPGSTGSTGSTGTTDGTGTGGDGTATGTDPGSTGGDTDPGVPELAGAQLNLLPPVIPPQTAQVTPKGDALVRVACPADAGICRGTIELVLTGSAGAAGGVTAARRRATRIGQARFSALAGRKPVVRVRLNRRGRRRVLRHRRTRARVVVTTHSADGKTVVTSRTITLQRRGPRSRRG